MVVRNSNIVPGAERRLRMTDKQELKLCPQCSCEWPNESEQAACIRLFNKCIVCRVEDEKSGQIKKLNIEAILKDQKAWDRRGG